jgi:hypothetical protein
MFPLFSRLMLPAFSRLLVLHLRISAIATATATATKEGS